VGDDLPEGVVLDGEILPWKDGGPLPFSQLQRRIGRKAVTKSIVAEIPVILMAYDLLEFEARDVRAEPLEWRRGVLSKLVEASVHSSKIVLSPIVPGSSWEELANARRSSRAMRAEGLMLKHKGSAYGVGRRRGEWWKWKTDPLTIDAVLIAAQPGSGKRASLHTDYTFGVWHEGRLVIIAKAYSGLTDEEIRRVDAFVRKNTIEKFGPVRTVEPVLVFELAFEGLNSSARHKSGVAVRFPRILRWRTDKSAAEANSLEMVCALLASDRREELASGSRDALNGLDDSRKMPKEKLEK